MIPDVIPPAHSPTPMTRRTIRARETGLRCTIFSFPLTHLPCTERLLPRPIDQQVTPDRMGVTNFGTPSRCAATLDPRSARGFPAPYPGFIAPLPGGKPTGPATL